MLTLDLIPWWVKVAAVAAVLAVVFGSGWYVEGLRWTAAAEKAKIIAQNQTIVKLRENISIVNHALHADSEQAIKDAKSLEELERITHELVAKTPDDACLAPDAVDGLRKLWE